MIATLRRSGLATSALPACEEGFSTDKDILSVYRLFAQSREDLLRALPELLVVHDFARELPRFNVAREVVARDRGVEPRRDDHPTIARDLLFAFADLPRLPLRRILGRADPRDLIEERGLRLLETGDRLLQHVGGAQPDR